MSVRFVWLWLLGLLVLPAALPAQGDVPTGYHTPPDKWKEPRIYQFAFWPEYEGRILSGETPTRDLPGKIISPNRAYWLALDKPDTSKPGPWKTTLYLFTERDTLQTLTILDHVYDVEAAWIHEHLVSVRVWWGRELGTDLIVDAETRAVIWREMFRSGGSVFQQWQEHAAAGTPLGQAAVPPQSPDPSATPGLPPRLPLAAAVTLGERFAVGTDLRGQHLHSVRLEYDAKNRKQHYWLLVWAWDQARLGGEYSLWVYMDGTVVERRLGP